MTAYVANYTSLKLCSGLASFSLVMALDDLALVQADGLGTPYMCSTLGIADLETH